MIKSTFDANLGPKFIAGLIIVILAVGCIAFSANDEYFGHSDNQNYAIALGSSITVQDLAASVGYEQDWIKTDMIDVETQSKINGDFVNSSDIFSYYSNNITAVGVGTGKIIVTSKMSIDTSLSVEIDSIFKSADTLSILKSSNLPEFSDNILTKSELHMITKLVISGKTSCDMQDFVYFDSLKTIIIDSASPIELKNYSPSEKHVLYVDDACYGSYINCYPELKSCIFTVCSDYDSPTVLVKKNGGVFDVGDNGYPCQTIPSNAWPEPMSRTGHSLAHFNLYDLSGAFITTLDSPFDYLQTQSVTAEATWEPNVYSLTFDACGGVVAPVSKQITYGTLYGSLPTPERTGYEFMGWFTSAEGGTQVNATDIVAVTEDQTLYAHWVPCSYTITFNAGEGTVQPGSITAVYDSTYGELPMPQRTGYTSGWYTAAEGGVEVISTDIVSITADQTLYSHWVPCEYLVTFDACGGTASFGSKTVTYDSVYGSLPEAERTGYNFEGWFTAAEGGTQINAADVVAITADQVLHAHWIAKTFKVTFDAGDGTVSPGWITVTYDSAYGDLPVPQMIGHTSGWYTSAEGGVEVISTDIVSITADQTLYSHWVPCEYLVTFDACGGTASFGSKTVTYDSVYGSLPEAERTGYDFEGWFTSAEGGIEAFSTDGVTITDNQTLFAHWTACEYVVFFDANGGIVSTESNTVMFDSEYGVLPEPLNPGYGFEGWFTELAGGDLVTTDTTVRTAGSHTLYAHWTEGKFHVFFDANGGHVNPESIIVTFNSTYGELPTPSRDGYHFDGWFTQIEGGTHIVSETFVEITGNQTLYAHWTPFTYTITFNANGGTVSTTSKIVTYDSPYGELPLPVWVNHGTHGWFTAAEGGTKVNPEDIVLITDDIELFAHWGENVTVTVNNNYGGGSVTLIETFVGKTYDELGFTHDDRAHYQFIDWFSEPTGGVRINLNSAITDNCTIYAQWIIIQYYVSFDSNGGQPNFDAILVNSGEQYGNLPEPSRTGYIFAGWYTSSIGGDKITATSHVNLTGNQILYAHWTPRTYTVYFDHNGGEGQSSPNTVTYDLVYGALPSPSRKGHTLDGWYTLAEGGSKIEQYSIVKITENLTLYAHWTPITYHITLNPNGGSLEGDDFVDVTYGTKITLPTPSGNGIKSFSGWFTTESAGDKIENGSIFDYTNITTLYAHWSSCFSGDSIVYLSDGSIKMARDVVLGDVIQVYDHENGCLNYSPVVLLWHSCSVVQVVTMNFEKGITLEIHGEHYLFDNTLNTYVSVNACSAPYLLGHQFYHVDCEGKSETLQLLGFSVDKYMADSYSFVTSGTINHLVNGFLGVNEINEEFCMVEEFNDNMKYDEEQLNLDIALFGFTDYSDWAEYLDEESFEMFSAKYINILIGKGKLTEQEIVRMIDVFLDKRCENGYSAGQVQ